MQLSPLFCNHLPSPITPHYLLPLPRPAPSAVTPACRGANPKAPLAPPSPHHHLHAPHTARPHACHAPPPTPTLSPSYAHTLSFLRPHSLVPALILSFLQVQSFLPIPTIPSLYAHSRPLLVTLAVPGLATYHIVLVMSLIIFKLIRILNLSFCERFRYM